MLPIKCMKNVNMEMHIISQIKAFDSDSDSFPLPLPIEDVAPLPPSSPSLSLPPPSPPPPHSRPSVPVPRAPPGMNGSSKPPGRWANHGNSAANHTGVNISVFGHGRSARPYFSRGYGRARRAGDKRGNEHK